MYIPTITTNQENFHCNPFKEKIGKDLILAKNIQGTVWINWQKIQGFEYLGQQIEAEAITTIRNDVNIISRRTGELPHQLINYFNLIY